jgi:LPS sulfotransferase NodH
VIISYPRTGSTFLVKVLNSCTNIICHSEIFHKKTEPFNRSILDKSCLPETSIVDKLLGQNSLVKLRKLKEKNYKEFLTHTYQPKDKVDAIGFKIFDKQNNQALEYLLGNRDIKKIILVRENFLRSFISQELALMTGVWDRHNESTIPQLNEIELDIEKFEIYKKSTNQHVARITQRLDNEGQDFLKLTYEEITKEFPQNKIEKALRVTLDNITTEIDQKQQNPFDLEKMISNYSDVKDKISEYV